MTKSNVNDPSHQTSVKHTILMLIVYSSVTGVDVFLVVVSSVKSCSASSCACSSYTIHTSVDSLGNNMRILYGVTPVLMDVQWSAVCVSK